MIDNGGLVVQIRRLPLRAAAPEDDVRPTIDRVTNMAFHLRSYALIVERSHRRAIVQRMPELHSRGARNETIQDLIVDAFHHQDALAALTYLASIGEAANGGSRNCRLQVGVVEDDGRAVAT